ncbi:MAG: hypothetical protein PHC84_01880 [Clostridia bacterium]|nr:hypothetical protein [Clostridia bacterium]
MKTTKMKVITVIPYAVALMLFVALIFSYAAIEAPAYASDDFNTIEEDMQKWGVDAPLQIKLRAGIYTYAEFSAPATADYVYTVTGVADTAVKCGEDIVEAKKLANNIFGVSLQQGKVYQFGLVSPQAYIAEITIRTEAEAYEWTIDGSSVGSKEELQRDGEYSLAFCINGNKWDTETVALSDVNYVFTLESNLLAISEVCPVGGTGITVKAKIGNTIFEKALTVIPQFKNVIEIEGTYNNDADRGLFWRYQADITALTYRVDYAGTSQLVTLDSLNGRSLNTLNPGQLYPLEIGGDIEAVKEKADTAEVTITGVQLAAADNAVSSYEISQSSVAIRASVVWVGAGTSTNPYQVSSLAHFNDIASRDGANVYFKQICNLDFNYTATTRGVVFDGHYDGNDMYIDNVHILSSNSTSNGGLFDINHGTITNFRHVFVFMNYDYNGYAGGMVGRNYGTINTPDNPYSSGLFSYLYVDSAQNCNVYVGGVAGYNSGTIIVHDRIYLYILSNGSIGGVAAYNAGEVTVYDGLADNVISGYMHFTYVNGNADDVGGIAGRNYGILHWLTVTAKIRATVPSSNSTYVPRIGGFVGTQQIFAECLYNNFSGTYDTRSNLTEVQRYYTDVGGVDNIGQRVVF